MDKKYNNIEDLLGLGEHIIKVSPKPEWDQQTGGPKHGSHKQGVSAKGFKWYMYSTKIGETWVNLFANDKNKAFFDSGEVEVVIKQKFDPENGQPVKKVYYNSVHGRSVGEFKREVEPEFIKDNQVQEEDVRIDDLPF